MQNANELRDMLINEFTENYMEKLFYFCLKKTGNNNEATDLTQDVALQIIVALNKGTIPTSFSAWVWQIARNRYSVWAKDKHNRCDELNENILDGEKENILEDMINKEQLALLRRELAFTKSDYRDIVIAYYINNQSIREIAKTISLPTNTIKSRILRARKILKEGIDMAREFGKRSYNPENVSFMASGSQPSGLPWKVVERKIPENILLQASNNPSTLEELSIELGIALPYMEEEVDILYNATLLEKQGDKYVTNFFILDKDCHTEVYFALRKTSNERSRLINELINEKLPEIRALGIAGDHIDDNTIRWWLVPDLIDLLCDNVAKAHGTFDAPKRANGESWGFVGYEDIELPEEIVMGHNGTGTKNQFWAYKYPDYSMWNQCGEAKYEQIELMSSCIHENRKISSFSAIEKRIWEGIDSKYAHISDDGYMVPDILVMTEEKYENIHKLLCEHDNYKLLINNVTELYEKIESIFKTYSHPVLHNNIGYNIRMELYSLRMIAIHDLVEKDVLKLPKDPNKSSFGMHMLLK